MEHIDLKIIPHLDLILVREIYLSGEVLVERIGDPYIHQLLKKNFTINTHTTQNVGGRTFQMII